MTKKKLPGMRMAGAAMNTDRTRPFRPSRPVSTRERIGNMEEGPRRNRLIRRYAASLKTKASKKAKAKKVAIFHKGKKVYGK